MLSDHQAFREEFHRQAAALFDAKDKEYRGDAPPLSNFREAAEFLGVSPAHIALVFAYKHFRAICTYVKNPTPACELTEPIGGRLQDLSNFVWVLAALIEEQSDE